MQRHHAKRVLATVYFTDIVNSTVVAEELGDARWKELLDRHHNVMRRELKRFGGKEIDTAGDGFFASFDQPAAAIRCAAAASEALQQLGIDIRAGIHVGECEQIGGKLGGVAVHAGARVMGQGAAADVLVSGTTRELVAGAGIKFEDRGVKSLKGLEGEWHIWAVTQVDDEPRVPPLDDAEAARRRETILPTPLLQRRWPRLVIAGSLLALAVSAFLLIVKPGADRPLDAVPADSVGIIDEASGDISEAVPTGVGPGAVVATAEEAWVARLGAGIVVQVDRATGQTETVSVNGGPSDLTVDDAGRVWVLNQLEGRLQRINPDDPHVDTTFELGTGTVDVAAGGGSVWVVTSTSKRLIRVDQRVDDTDHVGLNTTAEPSAVAYGEGVVWVVAGSNLLKIDSVSKEATRIGLRAEGDDVAVGAGAVWVTHQGSDSVSRIDPEAEDVTNVIDVGNGPSSVAASDQAVWIANSQAGTVTKIDAQTKRIETTVDVGEAPLGVATGEGVVWVTVQPAA